MRSNDHTSHKAKAIHHSGATWSVGRLGGRLASTSHTTRLLTTLVHHYTTKTLNMPELVARASMGPLQRDFTGKGDRMMWQHHYLSFHPHGPRHGSPRLRLLPSSHCGEHPARDGAAPHASTTREVLSWRRRLFGVTEGWTNDGQVITSSHVYISSYVRPRKYPVRKDQHAAAASSVSFE